MLSIKQANCMFLYSIVKEINVTGRAHQTQPNHLHFSQITPVLFCIIAVIENKALF